MASAAVVVLVLVAAVAVTILALTASRREGQRAIRRAEQLQALLDQTTELSVQAARDPDSAGALVARLNEQINSKRAVRPSSDAALLELLLMRSRLEHHMHERAAGRSTLEEAMEIATSLFGSDDPQTLRAVLHLQLDGPRRRGVRQC